MLIEAAAIFLVVIRLKILMLMKWSYRSLYPPHTMLTIEPKVVGRF